MQNLQFTMHNYDGSGNIGQHSSKRAVIKGLGIRAIILFKMFGFALFAQAPNNNDALFNSYFNPTVLMTDTELNALLERIIFVREPFLGSWSHRQKEYSRSLGHFFTQDEYQKLMGNPALGYFHVGHFIPSSTIE